ncbi:hypothetical protein K9M09_01385, partial [Patescibacteria group bacterium]|nr:hypothetical protein [Patescibacteria group bacterium]
KLGLDFGEQVEIQISRLASEFGLDNCLRALRRFLILSQERPVDLAQLPLEIAVVELCLSNENNKNEKSSHDSLAKTVQNINTHTSNAPVNNIDNNSIKKTVENNKIKSVITGMTDSASIAPNLSAAEISVRWPEVLMKIKKHNHSLSFVLQNSEPQDLLDGVLSLCFRYKFHRDRILDVSIRSLMESSLAEVFGGKVVIEAILDESRDNEAPVPDNSTPVVVENNLNKEVKEARGVDDGVLGGLLATFGGEAV